MKFIVTTIIAVLCFLASGLAYRQSLQVFPLNVSERSVNTAIESLISAFASHETPKLIINSATMPQFDHPEELLAPKALLPSSASLPFKPLQAVYQYAHTCNPRVLAALPANPTPALRKVQLWHEFLCRRRKNLPDSFFSQPPYIHPSGRSYVALALESQDSAFDGNEWLSLHRRELHIQEMPLLSEVKPLSPLETFLNSLDSSALKSIARAQHLIIASNFLILRQQTGENQLDYRVFERDTWQNYIDAKPFIAIQQDASISDEGRLAICVLNDGNICWQPNPRKQTRYNTVASWFFFAGLIVLLGNLCVYAVQRARKQRRESSARIFALRTMTHELRTPVASLELSLERFRNQFDDLAPDHQVSFMHMCDDVQRLRRLIETSKNYLSSGNEGSLLTLKPVSIPSLNDYFTSVLEPYAARISWTLLAKDQAFCTDPYWLEICVKNLLDNALIHGEKPVTLQVTCNYPKLEISIQDSGMNTGLDLKEMTKPFVKQSTSPGLGLGLNMVQQILQVMAGELSLRTAPTTFTITLENARE